MTIASSQNTKMPQVPLCDLAALHAPIATDIKNAINEVIDSQAFINGPQVEQLECAVAKYCGTAYAVGCSSGTDALLMALMALDIGPGDEVITTPYSFFATVGAIVRLGATPVFVDIEPNTYNIDANLVEESVTRHTKAVIPVHLFGQMADMDPILNIAKRHGLYVIEDAAQAIGAKYDSHAAGSMGDMGCFSFFPSKNLGCFGDGGMVVTNSDTLADRLRIIRNHGARRKYYHDVLGGNFRLDSIQAAVLLTKLRYLDGWNNARRAIAALYMEQLASPAVALPVEVPGRYHVYNQCVLSTTKRELIQRSLADAGIATAVYYPSPLHYQLCVRDTAKNRHGLPNAERAALTSVAVPIHPCLSRDIVDRVSLIIRDICDR